MRRAWPADIAGYQLFLIDRARDRAPAVHTRQMSDVMSSTCIHPRTIVPVAVRESSSCTQRMDVPPSAHLRALAIHAVSFPLTDPWPKRSSMAREAVLMASLTCA